MTSNLYPLSNLFTCSTVAYDEADGVLLSEKQRETTPSIISLLFKKDRKPKKEEHNKAGVFNNVNSVAKMAERNTFNFKNKKVKTPSRAPASNYLKLNLGSVARENTLWFRTKVRVTHKL